MGEKDRQSSLPHSNNSVKRKMKTKSN
jgi:hypothetical protein